MNPRCLSTSPVFKTGAFNHSAISPNVNKTIISNTFEKVKVKIGIRIIYNYKPQICKNRANNIFDNRFFCCIMFMLNLIRTGSRAAKGSGL